ncbi:MAG: acyl-CoA synthetase FdrA [Chloroflexota bacterium]
MSVVRQRVFRNAYRDSVELMRIAAEIERLPGVTRAGLVMATPANLAIIAEAGLDEGLDPAAGPNDMVVALSADAAAAADAALERAATLMRGTAAEVPSEGQRLVPTTIAEGVSELPDANLALVSTPGPYATAEALKALKRGMHVFLFSDNVPVEDEIELKRIGLAKELLVMGPDCGTAIIDGIPLGFANAVRRGGVGLVGASGTGLQQVTCLLDAFGAGVAQAIGVGGRDLHEEVGGVMMLAALERLVADEGTDVVVLISKPPSPAVAARVLGAASAASKPVVVNFLGGDADAIRAAGARPATTFEEAALAAASLSIGAAVGALPPDAAEGGASLLAAGLVRGQDLIAGLYSGGSLASEAKVVLKEVLGAERAADQRIVDLGDDEYTVGRPHPMIDPRLRSEKIEEAGADPRIAVILLDIVLGYASHPDPAGALAPAIEAARAVARQDGRGLALIASVCGTPGDPQGLESQHAILTDAGVHVVASNARAARLAGLVAQQAALREVHA